MRAPRSRIAWLMVWVAIVGFNCWSIRMIIRDYGGPIADQVGIGALLMAKHSDYRPAPELPVSWSPTIPLGIRGVWCGGSHPLRRIDDSVSSQGPLSDALHTPSRNPPDWRLETTLDRPSIADWLYPCFTLGNAAPVGLRPDRRFPLPYVLAADVEATLDFFALRRFRIVPCLNHCWRGHPGARRCRKVE